MQTEYKLCKCLIFVISSCMTLTVVESQSVSVDSQVTADLGGKVTLRCHFIEGDSGTNVTQVEWTKDPGISAFAVFNPTHGTNYPSSTLEGRVSFTSSFVNDASIRIRNVNKTDEGEYICKYITFPQGNLPATITLTVKDHDDQPWKGKAAMVSGIVTSLLLIFLITAAVCIIMMKRKKRCDAVTHSCGSSSNHAAEVTGEEDTDLNYADIRQFRPAHGNAVQPREGTEYAELKQSGRPGNLSQHAGGGEGYEQGGGTIYAQVSRR